jgi:branched-chain amino acid transport system permease protein
MLIADLVINGLITGVFYALMAVGLALIFGVLKVVNFAHGEFYMIGAYVYVVLANLLGISVWLALPGALLAGAMLGWATERTLMRPLYSGYKSWNNFKDEYAIIVTFGLSLLLINLVDKGIGPYPFRGVPVIDIQRIEIGPIMLSGHRLVAFLLSVVVLIGTAWFLRYSYWGRLVQAVAQNRLGASLAGINTAKASAIVFAMSGALAAFAGALLSPIINASPEVGIFPAVKSYVIVVLGGMGSVPGAIIGALGLGVLESLAAVYISFDHRDTYGLVILILVLLLRPQGLLGEKGRDV